jgi:hypothetical protein
VGARGREVAAAPTGLVAVSSAILAGRQRQWSAPRRPSRRFAAKRSWDAVHDYPLEVLSPRGFEQLTVALVRKVFGPMTG